MKKVLQYQGYHLLAWIVLGGLLYGTTRLYPDGEMRIRGLSASQWIGFSWTFAAVFQFWVAFFWRLELYGGKVSARMGKAGFPFYQAGYVVFGMLRFLPLVPISQASPRTAAVPAWASVPALVVTIPLSLWGLYCAAAHFGLTRAAGIDHFDPAYRKAGFEKRGIYRYTPNVMYTVVLLALYHPGLIWQSAPGLVAAAAHHAFVWVHYFCTERPDLSEIYGGGRTSSPPLPHAFEDVMAKSKEPTPAAHPAKKSPMLTGGEAEEVRAMLEYAQEHADEIDEAELRRQVEISKRPLGEYKGKPVPSPRSNDK